VLVGQTYPSRRWNFPRPEDLTLMKVTSMLLLLVLWQLFDKTAGDFPGVEIAASDLGLAPQHLD